MNTTRGLLALVLAGATFATAAVTITVQADSGRKAISPWLYGRNNNLSDDSTNPVSDSLLRVYREAGLRMLRENGGNNATKYNWRRKLTSHPDWYNNVYAHDWGYSAKTLQDDLPGTQGLYAFQLLGKAASNTRNNFNDNGYNGSKWWSGVAQNLAGGGTVNEAGGGDATTEGDPSTYLMDWPADSTAAILDGWFGTGGKGLDASRFQYWSMDNEPEIWGGTHDDVVSTPMDFETYFQKYLAVAKAVRGKAASVKLVGPVYCNDWQWWTWNNALIDDNGTERSSMEMFIKRIGEEEKASGMKLLDVFDMHFYPGYDADSSVRDLLQLHRLFWDTTYAWPGSNGVHMVDGKWNKATPNYTYERVRRWMIAYLGEERPVALTEFGAMRAGDDIDARDVFYASLLGTFADHGGEILTAWDWYPGWWEVLHLFSRNAKAVRVRSVSSQDSLVSAYSSIATGGDSLVVVLVNRDTANAQDVSVNLTGFVAQGDATTLRIAGLTKETFVSHASNALKSGSATMANGAIALSLPALSITAVTLVGTGKSVDVASRVADVRGFRIQGNALVAQGAARIDLFDLGGRLVGSGTGSLRLHGLPAGLHLARSGGQSLPVMVP